MRRTIIAAALGLLLVPVTALAKDTRFWNLTANTITSLQLSPAGKNEWGRNQTDNDDDHTVDHDERLKITGTKARMKAAVGTAILRIAALAMLRCSLNMPLDATA